MSEEKLSIHFANYGEFQNAKKMATLIVKHRKILQ